MPAQQKLDRSDNLGGPQVDFGAVAVDFAYLRLECGTGRWDARSGLRRKHEDRAGARAPVPLDAGQRLDQPSKPAISIQGVVHDDHERPAARELDDDASVAAIDGFGEDPVMRRYVTAVPIDQ